MFNREMKINFKSFIIWTSILLGIFLVVFLVYPSITQSDNIKMMDEYVNLFPEEMLKALNMDLASLDNVFGWLKTEGFIFIFLIIGSYTGILGSNILLKEENDKTIEYLNMLPVNRCDIVISKVFCGLIYIVLMVLILGIFNYIGLSLSGEFDKKLYLLLSVIPLFPAVVIYALCMFLSTFAQKSKKMFGLSIGIVFISYVLNMLSSISDSVEFLKYFSIFTLADIRYVIENMMFNWNGVFISIILSVVLFIFTIIRYNKKELV